jgi:hypothetical protein
MSSQLKSFFLLSYVKTEDLLYLQDILHAGKLKQEGIFLFYLSQLQKWTVDEGI